MTHLWSSLEAELEAVELSEADILCADLYYSDYNVPAIQIVLPENYTNEEYEEFVDGLDIEYDCYGEAFSGTVWLKNGGWITWDNDTQKLPEHSERWFLFLRPPISDRCTGPKTKSSAKRQASVGCGGGTPQANE